MIQNQDACEAQQADVTTSITELLPLGVNIY